MSGEKGSDTVSLRVNRSMEKIWSLRGKPDNKSDACSSIVGSEDVELHIAANCCFIFLWCKPELKG